MDTYTQLALVLTSTICILLLVGLYHQLVKGNV